MVSACVVPSVCRAGSALFACVTVERCEDVLEYDLIRSLKQSQPRTGQLACCKTLGSSAARDGG